MMIRKPEVLLAEDIIHRVIKGGKTFLMVVRFYASRSFDNCCDEKRFVNIDTTTGLISSFHCQTPFLSKNKKPLTELPHNLTKALKQFLVYGLVVPL